MKTLPLLSTTRCLSFSLALLLPALAHAQPKDTGDQKRAQRLDKLVKTQDDLAKLCAEVKGWTKADDKTGVSTLSNSCARLKEDDQRQLAADVEALQHDCASLEDKDDDLAALVKEDAKLEKVTKDHWEALTDKLGDIVLRYKGKNEFGSSTEDHYLKCYGKDCSKPLSKCQAINQLTSFSRGQFTTGYHQTLKNAIKDATGKGGKDAEPQSAAPDEE